MQVQTKMMIMCEDFSFGFITWEAQKQDKDAACDRSAWRDEGSGICHRDLHHLASSGIPTPSAQSFACRKKHHLSGLLAN